MSAQRWSIRLVGLCVLGMMLAVPHTPSLFADPPANRFLAKPDLLKIYGRIQYVNAFPDYKVQVVQAFPDLRVKHVTSFPDGPGKWQIVDSFPDFKIQIVTSFSDFKICYVDAFPGKP